MDATVTADESEQPGDPDDRDGPVDVAVYRAVDDLRQQPGPASPDEPSRCPPCQVASPPGGITGPDRLLLDRIIAALKAESQYVQHFDEDDVEGIQKVRSLGRRAGRELGWKVMTHAADRDRQVQQLQKALYRLACVAIELGGRVAILEEKERASRGNP